MNLIQKNVSIYSQISSMLFPTIQCISKADLSLERVVVCVYVWYTYFLVIHNNTANPTD
jgi:hypothetical protein